MQEYNKYFSFKADVRNKVVFKTAGALSNDASNTTCGIRGTAHNVDGTLQRGRDVALATKRHKLTLAMISRQIMSGELARGN